MIIGVDLDNTIINYHTAFRTICHEEKIMLPDSLKEKREIRDYIRSQNNGENVWQRIQRIVYTKGMRYATLFPHVTTFFYECKKKKIPTYIISHKTKTAQVDGVEYPLQSLAKDWIVKHKLLPSSSIFFEETRERKVLRILSLHCTHMIDDLEETFEEPLFPNDTKPYLFNPLAAASKYPVFSNWEHIYDKIFS